MVTPRYLPLMGGVEHHVHEVGWRFARAGVDVTVLTTDPAGQWSAEEVVDGVRILRVPSWPRIQDYYFAPEIYGVIRRGAWDIVHIQSYHTLVAPMAMLAALGAKIPYVVTFHGGGHSSWLRNTLRGSHRALLRPLLVRAARFIAVAQFEIDLFGRELRLPRDRFVYIPNGSDIANFAAPVVTPGEGTLIASIGRLERYKGHQRVIAALPYILEQQPDVRLWVAGTGPYEAALVRQARELGVADRVEIRAVPMTERQTMAQELSKAALVTLLSEYETHPIAVLEALKLGRPVLVADTSGLSELAARGLARAVSLKSTAQQVAQAVLEQLRKPLAPAGVELPTWDDCAGDLLTLYYAVTGRPQSAT